MTRHEWLKLSELIFILFLPFSHPIPSGFCLDDKLSHALDNAESYITKEAAKELNKLNARGKQQDLAYDEILEQYLSVHQSGDDGDEERTFEKKYFDYLPNDLDSEDVADEDATRELLKLENARVDNERRVNSRRFRRDLPAQNRHKRQSIFYVPYPLFHYSPSPNVDFYYPQELSYFSPIQSRFDQPSPTNNNPWIPENNRKAFHAPGNFYLPPSRPGQKWVTQFSSQLWNSLKPSLFKQSRPTTQSHERNGRRR